MKRIFLFLILITLPILSSAKQCPTCLSTFQVQTTRGLSKELYRWLVIVRNPKNKLKYNDIKHLFNKEIKITVNGVLKARGLKRTYEYLSRLRQQQPIVESKLRKILVEGSSAAMQCQIITQQKGRRYRALTIAILHYKAHKLYSWESVSHTSKLKG